MKTRTMSVFRQGEPGLCGGRARRQRKRQRDTGGSRRRTTVAEVAERTAGKSPAPASSEA